MISGSSPTLELIGCGQRTQTLLRHMQDLGQTDMIAGLYDPSGKAIQATRRLPGRKVTAYENPQTLAASPALTRPSHQPRLHWHWITP